MLETQSAVLSNYEVFLHVEDVRKRYASNPDYIPAPRVRGVAVSTKLGGLREAVESVSSAMRHSLELRLDRRFPHMLGALLI